jgi:serine/threonine protein kinase/tetratricopeptide (TPR) repeat protein
MSSSDSPLQPTQLGGFEVLRRLGAGGMAEVFLAKKQGAEGTHKILVLKRVLPAHGASRRFRAMFVEEALLATRLNHPNIVQVYEFTDYGDEGLLLSMEWVEGPDLGKLMSAAKAKTSRIPPWVGAYIVSEVGKGLHYAHERKEGGAPLDIVHRDVSPQNVLLSYEGAVKIADFGIARANLFRNEEAGVIKGKFGYMSPEQARGEKVDRRSDIYALGVVLHELLTGRPLHGSLSGDDLLGAVRAGVVEPPSTFTRDVPPELEVLVMRALAKNAQDRFQSARDMSAAISRALFQKQEFVDAAAVEATIAQLTSREETSPGLSQPPSLGDDSVALSAMRAPSMTLPRLSVPPPSGAAEQTGAGLEREGREGSRMAREVRHVAVVTLKLHGFSTLERWVGPAGVAKATDKIRATLDNIAYKRGAVFTWDTNQSARALVGLTANPARAAADAAWLAIDVHEALAGASEDLVTPVRASIGIVRGVASGERDPMGHLVHHELQEPANLLSNLVGERTPIGRTWVAGGLYRLLRREFRWGDAPTIDVGSTVDQRMPATMRIYALERALTREERVAEMAFAPHDLVGREAEKADLHSAYHLAASSTGEIVTRVIIGEMGIGKSALVATFLSELPPDARVLRAECSPARGEIPFGIVSEFLREATGATTEQSLDDVTNHILSLLGPLASGDRGDLMARTLAELVTGQKIATGEDDDLGYRKKLIFTGVRYVLASLASRQPLVVVIEGLQWGDRAGLDLLTRLLRRKDRFPILTLFVTRPEERVVQVINGLVQIELKGLGAEEQVRLVQSRLGVQEGVTEVLSDLLAKVAGNPFFLLEMVDALLERGTLEIRETKEGHHALVRMERPGERAQPLPSTLEQLIGDRLHELPAEEHAVIDWLAVAGGPLSGSDILALASFEDDEPIARLFARGLCDKKGDDVDFRHPLVRDVAYFALDPAERTSMHRRLGQHLVKTPLANGISAAIVARHLARGELPEVAAAQYLEAASAARATFQTRLAIRFYQRVLALLPPDDVRRLVAHEALETIYRTLGRRKERKKHLLALRSLARNLGQSKWVALALVRTARLDLDEGFLARGLPNAQRAEEVARAGKAYELEVEAQSIQSELLRELGDAEGALAACDRALEVVGKAEVPLRARAEVLQARATLLRRASRVREAVECYAQAIAIFRRAGARRQEARAKNALAFAMFILERFEDAIALALASLSIDLEIGGRFQIAKTLTTIGRSYSRLGDQPRALAYLKRARDAHERYGDQNYRAATLLASAEALIETGDLDAAHVFTADAAALNSVTNKTYDYVHERIVRARIARRQGNFSGAVRYAQEARQGAEAQGLLSFQLYATSVEAVSLVDADSPAKAADLAAMAFEGVETIQGSEFGTAIRSRCFEALRGAGSPLAGYAQERARIHIESVAAAIRDPRLKALFLARPLVANVLSPGAGARGSSA